MATAKEVAEWLDCSERRVHGLVKAGIIPKRKANIGFDIQASVAAYINYLRHRAEHGKAQKLLHMSDEERMTYEEARLRTETEKGRKLELENEKEQGNLIPSELLGFILQSISSEAAVTLKTLPGDFKRKFPNDPHSRIEHIERTVARAANAMSVSSENLEAWIDDFNATSNKKR